MSTSEMMELHRTIGHLRQCVGSLRSLYGDASAVRRLANDVDRLGIDASDLDESPPRLAHPVPEAERVAVPEGPYDHTLWQGADDEGVGGHPHER
ncbi:hypothetical protein ACFYVR_18315 [Rhodococcus sp. NPDC003318]|uniref:hypothetical protein n=1 Tax=Rhodococcus sp. NPDC003318 TaxID=3364503 RepID=UPI003683D13D